MSEAKKSFYINHEGTSLVEIGAITLLILLAHTLYLLITSPLSEKEQDNHNVRTSTTEEYWLWGYVCYVFLPLLSVTLYAGFSHRLLFLCILGCLFCLFYQKRIGILLQKNRKLRKNVVERHRTINGRSPRNVRVQYLSVFRASMLLLTSICILSVDMPLFPRRYAKTETWGTSLMDLGVSSFVFSSGLTSSSSTHSFAKAFKAIFPLLALAVARIVSLRASGYHEQIAEYGTHWNFFITLSLLPPLIPLAKLIRRIFRCSFIVQGMILALIFQIGMLGAFGLNMQRWMIAAPRTSILSANKEGFTSMTGYAAIFLLGMDAGSIVLPKPGSKEEKRRHSMTGLGRDLGRSSPRSRGTVLGLLTINAICYSFAYAISTQYFGLRPSRRMANLPYISYTAAHNTIFLLCLAAIETVLGPATEEQIQFLDGINSCGLFVFLISNIFTGTVNLLIGDSLMVLPRSTSMGILCLYMVLVCLIPQIKQRLNSRLEKEGVCAKINTEQKSIQKLY